MSKEPYTVGVYHRDESCRKAALRVLSSEFECKEIEDWDGLRKSGVDTIVILAPELLYPVISFEEMIECVRDLKASVVMVNNDDSKWWVFRLNFQRLRRPSNELLIATIKAFRPFNKSRLRKKVSLWR